MIDSDVAELIDGYRANRFDPVDAVTAAIDRIERLDGILHAVAHIRGEAALFEARASAARWNRGEARPLEGIPIGVKDVIDVAGVPTAAGVAALADNIPAEDAEVVRRLCADGAIVVAKLATSAFAFADPFARGAETTRNPWATNRFPGGTSAGNGAALAARYVPLAVGTDSAGSVRIPAAHSGVCGMKPTHNSLPLKGVIPGSWSLDSIGVMGRSVDGIARAMRSTAVAERVHAGGLFTIEMGRVGRGISFAGLRIGVLRGPFTAMCTGDGLAAFEAALEVFAAGDAVLGDLALPMLDVVDDLTWPILGSEMASAHQVLEGRSIGYGDQLRAFLAYGRTIPAVDYLRCLRLRVVFQRAVTAAMADVDVVVCPTVQTVAARLPELTAPGANGETPWFDVAARNTLPFSLAGLPAISLPIGCADEGLPFGLQIVAGLRRDRLLLQVASAFQTATTHHREMPSLAGA